MLNGILSRKGKKALRQPQIHWLLFFPWYQGIAGPCTSCERIFFNFMLQLRILYGNWNFFSSVHVLQTFFYESLAAKPWRKSAFPWKLEPFVRVSELADATATEWILTVAQKCPLVKGLLDKPLMYRKNYTWSTRKFGQRVSLWSKMADPRIFKLHLYNNRSSLPSVVITCLFFHPFGTDCQIGPLSANFAPDLFTLVTLCKAVGLAEAATMSGTFVWCLASLALSCSVAKGRASGAEKMPGKGVGVVMEVDIWRCWVFWAFRYCN